MWAIQQANKSDLEMIGYLLTISIDADKQWENDGGCGCWEISREKEKLQRGASVLPGR